MRLSFVQILIGVLAVGLPADTRLASPVDTRTAVESEANAKALAFFPSSSQISGMQGFARVVNRSTRAGDVTIVAIDDAGNRFDALTLSIDAGETAHFNSDDLENGNEDKGLSGGTGRGQGDWRLELSSTLDFEALSFIRTPDGFLTSMHDTVPIENGIHHVAIFNPGSNANQRSMLRLVNTTGESAVVSITGTDDEGEEHGEVRASIPAGASRTFTAADLESGGAGLEGALGDGAGKWRLAVRSPQPILAMSLLSSAQGVVTNLSTAPGRRSMQSVPETAEEVFRVLASPVVQEKCVGCHAQGGAADQTRLLLVTDAERHHQATNLRLFEEFLSEVVLGAELVLEKISDPGHGGGVQVEPNTTEFAAFERLVTLIGEYIVVGEEADVFVYRFVGENTFSLAGLALADVGDTNGDGLDELIVGSENFADAQDPAHTPGRAYLVSGRDLASADLANGLRNSVISLGDIASQRHSWTMVGNDRRDLVGSSVVSAGDHTGDGLSDFWVGARGRDRFTGEIYLVSQSMIAALVEETRQFDLSQVAARSDTWVLVGEEAYDGAGRSIASADVDGDGFPDLIAGAPFHGGGAVYVVPGRSLSAADAMDGMVDRRVGLEAVAHQANGWKLLSEGDDRLLGTQVVGTGDVDDDGREDFVVAATGLSGEHRSAVYLVSAASLEVADAADGATDGVVQMGLVADGETSWKLVGEPGTRREGRSLAVNDLDGDGSVELLIGSWWDIGEDAKAYIVAVSDLEAADAADGVADGVVEIERAVKEPGSYSLTGSVGDQLSVASTDFDGDGRNDAIIGAPWWSDGAHFRPSPTKIHSPGAVYLLSGADLARAADRDGAIDLERTAELPMSWKVVGESGMASDSLGYSVSAAGDLDGDGVDELALGCPLQVLPFLDGGTAAGPGGVVVLSGMDLATADSRDGLEDGVVHLNDLEISHLGGELPEPSIVAEYDDHVVVMNVPRDWSRVNGMKFDELIRLFLAEYEDVFDYVMFVSNLPLSSRRYYYAGNFIHLSNPVEGIGVSARDHMAGNRLRGFMHFSYVGGIDYAGAHEVMHSWANFVLDVSSRPHWGFSSANGQLGGFDLDDLVDLGDGRYTAGKFSPDGNVDVAYGPLELYLAGWIPAEEVPDLWVARDGRWTGGRDDNGDRIFSASDTGMWTVEQLVEEHGLRAPSPGDSQRRFRAAAVLIVEEEHPYTDAILADLAGEVRRFGHPGTDDHEAFNFWEASGGRASIKMGGLSDARRAESPAARQMQVLPTTSQKKASTVEGRVLRTEKSLCGTTEPTGP